MTACYIGPSMCFGSSPPSPPPTHTHTQKKNQSECSDQRIGCLTCCLKHTSTTTPCKRRKIMRLTQTTNMDYEKKTNIMVVLVESHQISKTRKCEDRVIRKVTLSSPCLWACFHPPFPYFSGILKVMKFLLNHQYEMQC